VTPRPSLDDVVDEASMGSFPASDAPPFWARDPVPGAPDREAEPEGATGGGREGSPLSDDA
jgi:hypothetical protein